MAGKKKKYQVMVEMDIKKKKVDGKACPKFRVSYPHVFEPQDYEGDGNFQYSLTALFPKDADLTPLKKAAFNAKVEAMGKDKTKWKKDSNPWLQDGDANEDKGEAYAGHYFVVFKSKTKPQIVGARKDPSTGKLVVITDPEEFYAGCFAKASLITNYYDMGKNCGVRFNLQNLQKVEDGEPLSGKAAPDDDFEADESADEENAENYSDEVGEDDDDVGF